MKWDIVLKRKFTKIVAVLLALLVLPGVSLYSAVDFSGLFTFEAKAAGNEFLKSGFCGDTSNGSDGKNLSWVFDDDGTLTITGTGKMAKQAFSLDLRIKKVVIGEGVENVGTYAFKECSNITAVSFPNTLKTIDIGAFDYCSKIIEVILPDSVTTIDKTAFASCVQLKKVIFSKS